MLLEALTLGNPLSPMLPKLGKWMQRASTQGKWINSQEHCWGVVSLCSYFQTKEIQHFRSIARVWVGKEVYEETYFENFVEFKKVHIPMESLPREPLELILQREGIGDLFYRVAMTYSSLGASPGSTGFEISRKYFLDETSTVMDADVNGNLLAPFGSTIRVEIDIVR